MTGMVVVALGLISCDRQEQARQATDAPSPPPTHGTVAGSSQLSQPVAAPGAARSADSHLTSDLGCSAPKTPLGAVGAEMPFWCKAAGGERNPTFVSGENSWVDNFDHGGTNVAGLGAGYVVFDRHAGVNQIARSQHWRHNNHWMVDIAAYGPDGSRPPAGRGGSLMRPDRSFRAVDGETITVETTFAAGVQEYDEAVWGELIVTTGAQPSVEPAGDELYGFGQFRGEWTVGCRLHSHRTMFCALFDASDPPGDHGSRRWEISFYVVAGTSSYGGQPGPAGSERDWAWHTCAGDDPDANCRDSFRLVLQRSTRTLSVYVNNVKYFEQTGLPGLAEAAFWTQPFYAYNASWMSQPPANTVRYHWDRFAINP